MGSNPILSASIQSPRSLSVPAIYFAEIESDRNRISNSQEAVTRCWCCVRNKRAAGCRRWTSLGNAISGTVFDTPNSLNSNRKQRYEAQFPALQQASAFCATPG
jgi:hypothetical protein